MHSLIQDYTVINFYASFHHILLFHTVPLFGMREYIYIVQSVCTNTTAVKLQRKNCVSIPRTLLVQRMCTQSVACEALEKCQVCVHQDNSL